MHDLLSDSQAALGGGVGRPCQAKLLMRSVICPRSHESQEESCGCLARKADTPDCLCGHPLLRCLWTWGLAANWQQGWAVV